MSKETVIATLSSELPKADHEGTIPYFYCDTLGHVTIGVGFMIPNETQALNLSLVSAEGAGIPADKRDDRIKKDFARVKAVFKPNGNLSAKAYKASAADKEKGLGLTMNAKAIEAELARRLDSFYIDIRKRFGSVGFDKLAENAQVALLCMAYLMGAAGLMNNRADMIKALQSETPDYKNASEKCAISTSSAARNKYIKDLFTSCIKD